jgi:hypothetical protein
MEGTDARLTEVEQMLEGYTRWLTNGERAHSRETARRYVLDVMPERKKGERTALATGLFHATTEWLEQEEQRERAAFLKDERAGSW